ncbi:NaeI family type II restriction endonuclease [Streptomyces sp. TRM76323]|uniref:NaeI family type II restriction endonuclease n=1 Tax=Streptomyces tamarix TaxID=3078565 RepID=A0ABU3QQ73_9ACTN|nr:NaeI family type II restriction endonuclease [Streptomyces tamarix]MDT9684643.1 NaeI family type II restriction endonuclease [Streptomyces tamarix]
MSDALGRVLSALRSAAPHLDPAAGGGPGPGGGLDGTGLAEALWLAATMARHRPADPPSTGPPPSAAPGGDAPASREAGPQDPPRQPAARASDPVAPGAAARAAGTRGLHERLPGAGTRLRGHAVAAPRATGLPRALEVTRALRPWKRPWPEGRRGALDIEATVDGYARSGELIPVFAAAPERWFDLTLVVDRSPNMRVWEETLDDFTTVLDRLGAFRTLQVRDLLFDGAGRPQAPGQLRQADGRRLVVVVSDCVAAPWRAPAVWRLLREWAATTPMALLNPLPTKLWRRGGLNLPTVRFTPAAPGAHRSRLPHEAPPLLDLAGPDGAARSGAATGEGAGRDDAGAWLPIPVLSLSPHSLDRWSRAAMRGAPEGCTAVLVPPGGRLPGRSRPRAASLSPGTAAKGFLRTAAPRAVRLAVLCAPFDRLSLRLLHVIRRELVPDATTADVAEAVTSGLFELEQPAGDSGPLELVLPEEVRAVLRERLPAHEAWRVHQALDRHVASLGDGRPGLRSVAYDASGPHELPAEQEAFARASRQTLELLGLAVPGGEGPAPDGGGETDGAGATGAESDAFPPPPERFVERGHTVESLLARLADPAAGVVWVTAVRDDPGAGRTALALRAAHRFAGERHFVDMRGSSDHPVPPEAALHRLLTSLGAPDDGEARSAEELAAELAEAVTGRRVLLVLDDVPEPARMERLLPSVPGCAVLATTRVTDVAPEHRLAPLLDGEAADLLATWAGREGHEGRAALRELPAGRAWWPLTLRLIGSWIASSAAPPPAELSRMIRDSLSGRTRATPKEDLAAVLHLRLRALPAPEREALRRFVLVPTGQLTRTEAWALLGGDRAARAALDRLTAEGLLDRRAAGVYRVPEEVRRHTIREHGYGAEAAAPLLQRLVGHYLARAAALYEEDRPDSALVVNLGVRATDILDDPVSRHVWLDNALALAASAGGAPDPLPRQVPDLLLLLHVHGASASYRSRFEEAARAVIGRASARSGEPTARAVVALALSQYAAGAVADAASTLNGLPGDAWDRDDALRGPVNRLAGQLALARGAPTEAEEPLRRALDAFRADDDRFGVAATCLDLASVLTRLGRTDEVLRTVLEALGGYPDSVPHPLMRSALLALEDALATAGRYGELLSAQEALLAQYRTEGGDSRAEGLLLTRIARTLVALDRLDEAGEAARAALERLDGPGAQADREEAQRLLDEAGASPGSPKPRTIVAVETDGDPRATGEALSLALTSVAGGRDLGWSDHRLVVGDDRCLLFLPADVPLDALLSTLAERLPDELEAAGRHPAVRLAVHVGSVEGFDEGRAEAELNVRLALGMLRSAEFRALSENFPFHPALCVSPEVFGRLGHGDGLVAGRFVPREVTGADGRVVCVVLTPHVDLTAYDAELLMLARVFNDRDPDGRAMAAAVRESLDAVLAPEATGRYDVAELDEREKALIGPRLELELRRLFPAVAPFRLRLSLDGGRGWASFSRAEHGEIFLVVQADDAHARWSAGLLRMRHGMTVAPVHRDAPSPLTAQARMAVLWLHRGAPLPENVLLRLPEADRVAVLAPASVVDRAAELFRRVRERPVPEAALRAVTRRRDSARLVREAATALREEGVLVVGGNRRGRELARALRIPVPEADAYVSVRLTRRRPHHGGPSILAGGVAWVVAGPNDPVEPLPQDLPAPRRPR